MAEWISVKDRLPDEHTTVLFYCGNLQKGFCELDVTKNRVTGWFLSWDGTRFSPSEVTHWMPLPEPPKEDM